MKLEKEIIDFKQEIYNNMQYRLWVSNFSSWDGEEKQLQRQEMSEAVWIE